jgi:hypothetical protein
VYHLDWPVHDVLYNPILTVTGASFVKIQTLQSSREGEGLFHSPSTQSMSPIGMDDDFLLCDYGYEGKAAVLPIRGMLLTTLACVYNLSSFFEEGDYCDMGDILF